MRDAVTVAGRNAATFLHKRAPENLPTEMQDASVVNIAVHSAKNRKTRKRDSFDSMFYLMHASDALKEDTKYVTNAVKYNGLNLEFAAYNLQADLEVVLAAVNKMDLL